MRNLVFSSVVLFLVLTTCHPAFAQQLLVATHDSAMADPNETVEESQVKPKVEETMVVTATRSSRGLNELPVSTTVIDQKDLESAPALWADDILRTIPGVHMAMSGSSGTIPSRQRISMHGLGGTRALVMLDGIPIHDPFVGTVQWQKVPIDSLRQIEVVRGGNASLFGNSALGGTINLITRPVVENGIQLETAWGNSDTDRQVLTIDHMFSRRVAARINHFRYDSNGYIQTPTPGPVDITAWNDTIVTSGRVDIEASEATRLLLRANVSDISISQGTVLGTSKLEAADVAGVVHHTLGGHSLLSATVFHQDQTERIVGTNTIGLRESEFISNDATAPVTSTGASLEWALQRTGPLAFVSFGVDVSRIKASEHRNTFSRTGALTQDAFVNGTQQFAGIYGQGSWRPTDRLEVLASARVDRYQNRDGSEIVVGGATTTYPSSTSTQFDPRLSVRYETSARSAIRGSVYRAFKAPTLRELYRTTTASNTITRGNPFLGPETLVGGEIGFEWALDRSRFELNLYRGEVDGLRARAPVPGEPPNVIQQMNLGTSRSQGIEAIADLQLSRRWSIFAGYTYADATIIEDPDPALEGNLIPEVVPHIGTLSIRFHGDDGTAIDLRGRVLSTSYAEPTNTVPSPAHRVLDLSMSRPLRPWLHLFAVLENLLDEHYYYSVTPTTLRAAQPRTITAGVRFNLSGARRNG